MQFLQPKPGNLSFKLQRIQEAIYFRINAVVFELSIHKGKHAINCINVGSLYGFLNYIFVTIQLRLEFILFFFLQITMQIGYSTTSLLVPLSREYRK